jgi:hypothetical protein
VLYIAAYNRILSYKLRSSSKETAPVVKDLTCVQNLGIVLKHDVKFSYEIIYGSPWFIGNFTMVR